MSIDNFADCVPQWKRDLILRRRCNRSNNSNSASSSSSSNINTANKSNQNQLSGESAAVGCAGHQPTPSAPTSFAPININASDSGSRTDGTFGASGVQLGKCEKSTCLQKMVQERAWIDNKHCNMVEGDTSDKINVDSDSSEELQYGPGIVSKLKNRYLSLTLREQNAKVRPSILRKATSLEDLLDEDTPKRDNRVYESRMNGTNTNGNSKNASNRYRNAARGTDMKRARSVETISRVSDNLMNDARPKSLHEDIFSNKINTEIASDKYARINRPKRVAPVVSEKEKPPTNLVKQTKKIFESRPEMRTRAPQNTGEVAAKVANYKNIIIQTKVSNKPPIRHNKPVIDKKVQHPPNRLPIAPIKKDNTSKKSPLPSPIPDVSNVDDFSERDKKTSSLSETPDLILHSSPVHAKNIFLNTDKVENDRTTPSPLSPLSSLDSDEDVKEIQISSESQNNISKASSSVTFNFNKPLKLEINGSKFINAPIAPIKNDDKPITLVEETFFNGTNKNPDEPKVSLSPREIEKNFINTAKSLEQNVIKGFSEEAEVKPKRPARSKQEEQNCVVFKFTDRKDVPDYIGNDGMVRTSKIEIPKAGEGGITLLPGGAYEDAIAEYEQEMMSLEGPPSPCDVDFINDNILIDGRSSLSQKTKKLKMRIQFVEAVPQIFEYPSEASMLLEEVHSPQPITSSMGHSVPSLSGSSLANYTPKSSLSVEDFQLGVTKTSCQIPSIQPGVDQSEALPPEIEQPILFSSGTNSDILF